MGPYITTPHEHRTTESNHHKADALLPRLHQQILEIQQRLLGRAHVDKRRRDARLAAPARTPDLVHVVLDLLWHGEDDDVLDVVEVESFGGDAGCDHDVFGAGFKGLDGVLTFFLRFFLRGGEGTSVSAMKGSRTNSMNNVHFEPWMATASTPFKRRYSCMSAPSMSETPVGRG